MRYRVEQILYDKIDIGRLVEYNVCPTLEFSRKICEWSFLIRGLLTISCNFVDLTRDESNGSQCLFISDIGVFR